MTQQTINEDDIIERLEAGERTIEDLKDSLESTLLLLGNLTAKYTSLVDRYEAKSDANQVMIKSIVDLIQLDTSEISGMFASGLLAEGKLEKIVEDAQKKATAAVRKDINKWKKTWKEVDDEALPPALFDKVISKLKEEEAHVAAAEVAEYIDLADIANHLDEESIAYHMSEGEVADHIPVVDVANQISLAYLAEHISNEEVATFMDASEVALHIDVADLSNHVIEQLDTIIATAIAEAEAKVNGN